MTLLRKNSIADPEKLLLELVEDKIKELVQLGKEQSKDDFNGPKLNKVGEKFSEEIIVSSNKVMWGPN